MRRKKVVRPEAAKEKIHSKDEFELCYLRHQYFRRVKYNPSPKEMEPFQKITERLARNTFYKNKSLFSIVGFEFEDVSNIANVHLVSFLGLYSLENTPEKYKVFVNKFIDIQDKEPEKEDILDKNKASFTSFLKQRMEDVVRVCRQKAKNIKGIPVSEFQSFYGPKPPPKIKSVLLKNHEQYGFRKIDNAIYRSIRKQAKVYSESLFVFNKIYYIAVPLEKKQLNIEDLSGADMNPHDNIHNMTPEDAYSSLEETELWKKRQEEFDSKSNNSKTYMISNFIKKNKDKQEFKEEIRVAKKMLRELQ